MNQLHTVPCYKESGQTFHVFYSFPFFSTFANAPLGDLLIIPEGALTEAAEHALQELADNPEY